MARLVFAMNVSLDGYVDHEQHDPDPVLFRHWTEQVHRSAGCLYGRRLYGLMRTWDDDQPEWTGAERAFATAWRSRPKWVVSRTLAAVGPNATLIANDVGDRVRRLKADVDGEIDIGGPELAQGLADLGLVDEYRLYFHPVVLGKGRPFFAGPRPPLRLVASDRIGDSVVRLTCVPR